MPTLLHDSFSEYYFYLLLWLVIVLLPGAGMGPLFLNSNDGAGERLYYYTLLFAKHCTSRLQMFQWCRDELFPLNSPKTTDLHRVGAWLAWRFKSIAIRTDAGVGQLRFHGCRMSKCGFGFWNSGVLQVIFWPTPLKIAMESLKIIHLQRKSIFQTSIYC